MSKIKIRQPEERISPRKKLRTRVVFEDELSDAFLYFFSTDISLSGIFIESKVTLLPHSKLFLRFSLYEGDAPIIVTGEVARLKGKRRGRGRRKAHEKTGIGIRFLGLSAENLKKIEQFIGS